MKQFTRAIAISGVLFLAGCGTQNQGGPVISANPTAQTGDAGKQEYIFEQVNSVLEGNRLAVSKGSELKVIDLDADKEIKTITLPQPVHDFDVYGDYLVWSDLRNESKSINDLGSIDKANADIFLYNLKTGEEKQLTHDTSAQISPKIWQNYIVWMDNREDKQKTYPSEWKIRLYNIDTGEEKVISAARGTHTEPDINDGKVVWEDGRNVSDKGLRSGGNVPENNTDIYLYDIQTGKEMPIATGPKKEGSPRVSGNRVVWVDYNSAKNAGDIVFFDLTTQVRTPITNDKIRQDSPVICGDYIAWMDERRGGSADDVIANGKKPNSDIFIYDIKTKKEKLMTGDEPQIMPQMSDKWLVYTTSRQVNWQVHAVHYQP